MFDVDQFIAVINPPSGDTAVASVKDVATSGRQARAGKTMTVTLSADHRALDGASTVFLIVCHTRKPDAAGALLSVACEI